MRHLASDVAEKAVEVIKEEYQRDNRPWFLGFSGGKDSTVLLQLVHKAVKQIKNPKKNITIVYCNTGVEIPTISIYTKLTLTKLQQEFKENNLPISVEIITPPIQNSFFVKVIGRGYPPPTNKFIWCTDRLRINPVQNLLNKQKNAVILLGVRRGESSRRNKTLNQYQTQENYYFKQGSHVNSIIFSPIIDFNKTDVWTTILYDEKPNGLDVHLLRQLYKDAGDECPIIKDKHASPCSSGGRFGCWTCTVISQDKAVTSMTNTGHTQLISLLEFRNWLSKIRDIPHYRTNQRRNGTPGYGPFSLGARAEILQELLKTEKVSGFNLISAEEIEAIKQLWIIDKESNTYHDGTF